MAESLISESSASADTGKLFEGLSEASLRQAIELYPMTRDDRELLVEELSQGQFNTAETRAVYERVVQAAERKLAFVGLTLEQYHAVYQGLVNLQMLQDLRNAKVQQELSQEEAKTLAELEASERKNWEVVIQISESSKEGIKKYLESVEIVSTKDQHQINPAGPEVERTADVYNQERQEFHSAMVEERLQACEPQVKPKIVFLIGPPGGGKSSAREKLTQNFVTTDPDSLRAELFGDGFDPTDYAHTEMTQQEAFDVSAQIFERALAERRNILYEGTGSDYEGYLADMKKCEEAGYEVELKFVYTPPGECLKRSVAYRDRAVPVPFLLHSLRSFYTVLKFASAGRPPLEVIDNSGVLPRRVDANSPEFLENLKAMAQTYIRE